MYLRPISVSFFSASASVVMATRVMVTSWGTMGSMLRAKPSWTGPRTWPQLSAALTKVVITAPKVRMSKKLAHIQSRILRSRSGSSFFLALTVSPVTSRAAYASASLRLRGVPSFT